MATTKGIKRKQAFWLGVTLVLMLLFLLVIYKARFSPKRSKLEEKQPGPEYGQVKDAAGNIYPTIAIGKQVWMAENLRNTTFDCGDSVQVMFTNGLERGPGVPFCDGKARYAYYNNKVDLGYGVIYSYSTITDCKICPDGFRIPTKIEWEELIKYLGGKELAGKRLLKSGDSGFNAEMGGRIDSYGSVLAGSLGFWWSMDIRSDIPTKYRKVYNFEISSIGVVKLIGQDSRVGNYVRCVQVN